MLTILVIVAMRGNTDNTYGNADNTDNSNNASHEIMTDSWDNITDDHITDNANDDINDSSDTVDSNVRYLH